GRDRTGIVAAILLRLAGVGEETIVGDYEDTDERMRPRYDEWIAGMDDARRDFFLGSLAERGHPIAATLEHIDERYGDAAAYLRRHGLSTDDLARVRGRLLGASGSLAAAGRPRG
ncbi:MAG: tyrosine-protein phosphatase, partial [Thermoleophilaceae bacterium]